MEDLFEILIPLVIAGVYFFGNMLSKKSGDESEEGMPLPRQREPETDPQEAERQRQVREEIRRKIEARRGEAPASPAMPIPPPEPARAVRERTKQTHERVHETQAQKPVAVPVPEVVESTYDHAMQAQMERIEATRKKAAALRAQSAATSRKRLSRERRTSHTGGVGLKGPVRLALRNPGAARAAFIYGEVLGAPVGLRKNGTGALKSGT
ncbi:MAG: hypothetical protein GWO81_06210 [Verrucomicrobia bacterium]|nr:hypothetical protein [Verrucomicrobiota bacterium]